MPKNFHECVDVCAARRCFCSTFSFKLWSMSEIILLKRNTTRGTNNGFSRSPHLWNGFKAITSCYPGLFALDIVVKKREREEYEFFKMEIINR